MAEAGRPHLGSASGTLWRWSSLLGAICPNPSGTHLRPTSLSTPRCVDLRAVLPLGREPAEQRRHAELWDDGLHFSPRGSDRVGDAVYEVLRKHGV